MHLLVEKLNITDALYLGSCGLESQSRDGKKWICRRILSMHRQVTGCPKVGRDLFPKCRSQFVMDIRILRVFLIFSSNCIPVPLFCSVCCELVLLAFFFNLKTPRSRVFPEKVPGPQLVKKFPVFYGTRSRLTIRPVLNGTVQFFCYVPAVPSF